MVVLNSYWNSRCRRS